MDRSNIRFYEREGFIKPERLDNGYREYTEDDLNTLLWIRLLRSLQISLDDVRSLLADEKSMIEVMKNQVAGLEESKEDITYVQLICEKIRKSGSHISQLDPDEYLSLLENRAIASENDYFVIKKDRLPQVFNPWTRFFARTIDMLLSYLSLAGTQGKISLFSDFIEDIQSVISHDSSEGFAHTIYNIGAIAEIEQSGYMEAASSQFIVPADDVEEYFYKVSFSVERVK